jgi:hypothetical protein
MAVSYPRRFPNIRAFETYDLRLSHDRWQGRTRGGKGISSELSDAMWVLDAGTHPLHPDQFRIWQAWLASLKGGKTFWAEDVLYSIPRSLAVLPAGWDGTGTISSLTGKSCTLALGASAAGVVLNRGDKFNFRRGGNRSLHRVAEQATVGGGGAVTFEFRPKLNLHYFTAATATVDFNTPLVEMMIQSDDAVASDDDWLNPVSFRAVQVMF